MMPTSTNLPLHRRSSVFDSASPASVLPVQYQADFSSFIKYKSVVDDDVIDKMLENYIKNSKIVRLPIMRIDHSRYLMGTKVVMA
jgi:hypothetical protein